MERDQKQNLLVFWMCTWMDDAVHVQVQIIKFHLIGVWSGCVHRNPDPITFFSLWKQIFVFVKPSKFLP